MLNWLIKFNLIEILETLIIGFLIILISLVMFYYIWLKNKYFEFNTKYLKKRAFPKKSNFFIKLFVISWKIDNYEFWIKNIGFDGYCYLLFLRMVLKILVIYFIFLVFFIFIFEGLNIIFFVKNKINFFLSKDNFFNCYDFLTMFFLSYLIITRIKNLKKQIKKIHIKYFFKICKRENNLNFLRISTVLIKGLEKDDFINNNLTKKIKKILYKSSQYVEKFYLQFIPNFTKLFKLECKKTHIEFFSKLKPEINILGKMLMCYNIHDLGSEKYRNQKREINTEIREVLKENENPLMSSYAFVCFSNFQGIQTLINSTNLSFYQKLQRFLKKKKNLKIIPLINEKDINWKNCYQTRSKKKMLKSHLLKFLILIIILFLTTPATLLEYLIKIPFLNDLLKNNKNFIIESFIPPLLILGINKIILIILFKISKLIS